MRKLFLEQDLPLLQHLPQLRVVHVAPLCQRNLTHTQGKRHTLQRPLHTTVALTLRLRLSSRLMLSFGMWDCSVVRSAMCCKLETGFPCCGRGCAQGGAVPEAAAAR
jgi:hypothetical protein